MNEDPGYAATSKMIAETALTLALEKSNSDIYGNIKPLKGGVLTCSSALGLQLVRRIKANVMEIEVEEL